MFFLCLCRLVFTSGNAICAFPGTRGGVPDHIQAPPRALLPIHPPLVRRVRCTLSYPGVLALGRLFVYVGERKCVCVYLCAAPSLPRPHFSPLYAGLRRTADIMADVVNVRPAAYPCPTLPQRPLQVDGAETPLASFIATPRVCAAGGRRRRALCCCHIGGRPIYFSCHPSVVRGLACVSVCMPTFHFSLTFSSPSPTLCVPSLFYSCDSGGTA